MTEAEKILELCIDSDRHQMADYLRQSKTLQSLINKYKVAISEDNIELSNKLRKSIIKLDAKLKKVDSMLGRFTTPEGNYNKYLSNE